MTTGKILDALNEWASQSAHLDVDAAENQRQLAAGMIIRASITLNRAFDTVLRQYDLTFSRYHVLSVVHHRDPEVIPQKQIADNLCLQVSSITGHVNRLVDEGHMRRVRRDHDRRTTYLGLTAKGRRLYDDARQTMLAMNSGLGDMSVEDLHILNGLMQRVIDSSTEAMATAFDRPLSN